MNKIKSFKEYLKEAEKKKWGHEGVEYFVPKNDDDFYAAFSEIAQNIPKGSLDMAITKFGEGMESYYFGNREKLRPNCIKILKDFHGSVTEGKSINEADKFLMKLATNYVKLAKIQHKKDSTTLTFNTPEAAEKAASEIEPKLTPGEYDYDVAGNKLYIFKEY